MQFLKEENEMLKNQQKSTQNKYDVALLQVRFYKVHFVEFCVLRLQLDGWRIRYRGLRRISNLNKIDTLQNFWYYFFLNFDYSVNIFISQFHANYHFNNHKLLNYLLIIFQLQAYEQQKLNNDIEINMLRHQILDLQSMGDNKAIIARFCEHLHNYYI